MFANFQSLGKIPWSIDLLYSLHRGSEIAEVVLLANERDCHTKRTYRTGQSEQDNPNRTKPIVRSWISDNPRFKVEPSVLVSACTCVSTHPFFKFQKSKPLLMQTRFLKKYFQ